MRRPITSITGMIAGLTTPQYSYDGNGKLIYVFSGSMRSDAG